MVGGHASEAVFCEATCGFCHGGFDVDRRLFHLGCHIDARGAHEEGVERRVRVFGKEASEEDVGRRRHSLSQIEPLADER